MKKITTLILCFVMLLNIIIPAVAEETEDAWVEVSVENFDEISFANDVYGALSDDARAIFEYEVSNNAELLAFHRVNIDPTFAELPVLAPPQLDMMISAWGRNPLTTLNARLAALGLPVAVLYSLKALGISMSLAVADGALPAGDILTLISAAGVGVIFAIYWNTIATKWDGIVSAFQASFASIAATISDAFNTLQTQINKRLQLCPSLSYKGKKVILNGIEYQCTTYADKVPENSQDKYYPAICYAGGVWVALDCPITLSVAKLIMRCNDSKVGVWATSSTYARGLCGGVNAIPDTRHSTSEGYFYHYHHPSYRNFHCWYLF